MFHRTESNVKFYSKSQRSMSSIAMLTASIGFLLTCLIGYLVSLLWEKLDYGNYYDKMQAASNLRNLYIISTIGIFVSVIMTIIWNFKRGSASYTFAFISLTIYCLSQGIGFGSLFYVFDVREILLIFGMVGFILLFCYISSKVTSEKIAMSLGKISFFGFIGYLLASITILIISLFVVKNEYYRTVMLISTFVGGLLSLFYIVYLFYQLQRTEEFLIDDVKLRRKIAIFYGMQILVQILFMIWRIASVVSYFKRP